MPAFAARGTQKGIEQIAVREVMWASFVEVVRALAHARSPNARRMLRFRIPETPLPIIFTSRVERGIAVEWVHQREIAGLGKHLLGLS